MADRLAAGLPMRIGGCEWANSGNCVVPTLAGAGWQARSGDPCHINRPKFQALADQAAGVATCMIRERNLATASVGGVGQRGKADLFPVIKAPWAVFLGMGRIRF